MKRKLSADEISSGKISKMELPNFGSSFRSKLKTNNAINVLQEFVSINKKEDVVEQYINAGGTVKELIGLLKRFDGKRNFIVANTVFAAIHFIIVKSVRDLLLIQKDVEEACEELLCDYQATMQSMLGASSCSNSQRKTILRLLTAMVTLSSGLAKKILTLFTINPKVLRILTDVRSSSSAQKLRICFIHFLLSFLIDENSVIISELLQKKGLLTSIIPGMMNDKPETVVLILNTLSQKIVENLKISKTLKIHTFNTPTLRSIFKLYNYKNYKNTSRQEEQVSQNAASIDSNAQLVRKAAHEFLVVLCTSYKKGILFRDHRNLISGKNPNQLICTLLESIEEPHKDELQCLLISEILKACPEFVKTVLTKLEQHLQPNISKDWVNLVNFIIQIIEKQEMTIDSDDEYQAFSMISSVAFPPAVQKLLTRQLNSDVIHEHPIIRFYVIRLLLTVLRKIDQFLHSLIHKEYLREQIEQFLNKTLIPASKLINVWNAGIDVIENENGEDAGCLTNNSLANLNKLDVTEYYLHLADLLLLYKTLASVCFSELRLNDNVNITAVTRGIDNAELQFKCAQLIFHIYSPKPGQNQFSYMMKQFIEYFVKTKSVPSNIFEEVLRTTSFFDGCEDEITIWLYSIKKVPADYGYIISELFVKLLRTLAVYTKKYLEELAFITNKTVHERNDSATMVNYSCPDISNYTFTLNEETRPSKPLICMSPAIPALLDVLKSYESSKKSKKESKIIQSFTLTVFVHTLHLQYDAEPLKKLLCSYKTRYLKPKLLDYIIFWSRDTLKVNNFHFPLNLDDAANICFLKLVDGTPLDNELTFVSDIDETEKILLWNMCTFYTTRLNQMRILDDGHRFSNATKLFRILQGQLRNENLTPCLKLLLGNQNYINNFNIESDINSNLLSLILLDVFTNPEFDYKILLPEYSVLVSPYRSRFISLVLDRKEKAVHININRDGFSIDNLLKFIALSSDAAVDLLHLLIQLPINLLINEQKTNTSQWVDLVQCLFLIVATNLESPLESRDLMTLILKLRDLLKLNLIAENLEQAIIMYFRAFPHHLHDIPAGLIQDLLTHYPGPGVDHLGSYLVYYRSTLVPVLQRKILQNMKEMTTESVLVIINQFKSSDIFDEKFICSLYETYLRNIIHVCISASNRWLQNDGIFWTTRAISQCADEKICSETCDYLENSWEDIKLNKNKCTLLKVIFAKSEKVQLLVKLLIFKLNHLLLINENANWLCIIIENMAESIENLGLSHETLWSDFTKLALKISLQTGNATLMRTFKTVCSKTITKECQASASTIFQMTVSHSAFVNTMLSDSDLKYELVELYLILTITNISLMSSNHIPLLLGAYKATLSKADQLLLQVLHWYDENGIRFNDCRPYLWGEAAVTYHSIRTEVNVSLKRQPQPNQVLDLLDMNIVKNTIRYFPLGRPLRPGKQLLLLDCDVYDISFMLPLMSHLLAPESRISVQKFTRSGALCLVLIALSSEDATVRIAAFHCLQRFQSHLFSRENEIQLWYHFTNALKNGLRFDEELNNEECPPRLPCLVTTFLAHMSLVISESLHPLFIPLSNFLLAKPSFDVSTVPNFFILYYSVDLKHRDHQEWILKVIRDGLRFEKDWIVAQKCFLFKLLQQYYFTELSNETVNLLILQIIAKSLEIQTYKLLMVTKYGLLSWISQVVQNISKNQTNHVLCIIKILKLVVVSISFKNASYVLAISILLTHKLISSNINKNDLEELLYVVSESYFLCKDKNILSEYDMKLLIKFTKPFLDARCIKTLENCLRYNSVIGLEENNNIVYNYLIRILRRFIH